MWTIDGLDTGSRSRGRGMSSLAEFADRVWANWVARDPLVALEPNLELANIGSGSLPDAEQTADSGRQLLAELDDLRPAEAADDAQEAATGGYLRWLLTGWTEAVERYWYESPVAPYAGLRRINAGTAVLSQHTFAGPGDIDDYLQLLTHHAEQTAQIRDTLRAQYARGVRVFGPAYKTACESVADWQRRFEAAARVDEHRLARLSPAATGRLHDGIERALASEVRPAYSRVLEFLHGDYADNLPAEVGYCQFSGGERYYRMMARAHTTLDLSVERIHAIGVERVTLLADRMAEMRSSLGFTGSEAEFHHALRADPSHFAQRPGDVKDRYEHHLDRVLPNLETMFPVSQTTDYEIVRLPEGLERSMTFGYYRYPTPSEPRGAYVFNGSRLSERSLVNAASLILHELVPGHHLQICRQLENAVLPDVRRQPVLAINAFIEGWAEYAADLGWELGAYEDPYDAYGRLVMERFFAQRLVVDTGMNCLGWTLEQGKKYMRENTLESEAQVASETIRYSTDTPGQALAYQLGFLEFRRLREDASRALGSEFDLRPFHERILGSGALPLPVCAAQVNQWTGSSSVD